MITIYREELKREFRPLIDAIQQKHVMEDCIERELFIDRKPVVNLCHQRGYFVIMGEFYIQYVMDHIIMDVAKRQIGRAVQEVIFYDDYIEYEAARVKEMGRVAPSDQTGLNLN